MKKETLEENCCTPEGQIKRYIDCKGCDRKPKQETFEEAAERLVKETTLYGSQEAGIGSSARSYFETELRCVLLGMQWQQERSYSEEEVLGFGKFCLNKVADFLNGKSDEEDGKEYSIEELFEQFKKK